MKEVLQRFRYLWRLMTISYLLLDFTRLFADFKSSVFNESISASIAVYLFGKSTGLCKIPHPAPELIQDLSESLLHPLRSVLDTPPGMCSGS